MFVCVRHNLNTLTTIQLVNRKALDYKNQIMYYGYHNEPIGPHWISLMVVEEEGHIIMRKHKTKPNFPILDTELFESIKLLPVEAVVPYVKQLIEELNQGLNIEPL